MYMCICTCIHITHYCTCIPIVFNTDIFNTCTYMYHTCTHSILFLHHDDVDTRFAD